VLEANRGSSALLRDSGLSRLEVFSDGVFAIAIAFLIIQVQVPRVENDLRLALMGEWPRYVAYVVTFVVIGSWWANHHDLFEHIALSDPMLMLLNTVHLMCICFMPFVTAVLATYVDKPVGARTAVSIWVGILLLAAIAQNVVWLYASRAGLLRADVDQGYPSRRQRRGLVSVVGYGLALAVATVNVWASLALCLTIAFYFALPTRRPLRELSSTTHDEFVEPQARRSA